MIKPRKIFRPVLAAVGIVSAYSIFAGCDEGKIEKPPVGTMASIPAGCFNMGDAFNEGYPTEIPVHNVCISAFQMSAYEATNAEYKTCVDAAVCTAPKDNSSFTRSTYYGDPTYNNYPVIWASWDQAKAYCEWAGKRLPTEAEWEYAARGGLSGKRFPWGNTISCANANYISSIDFAYDVQGSSGSCVGDTIEVGSYAANKYGLYDMAGNVSEWVNDWAAADYYSSSPTNDPKGPSLGTTKIQRGGNFHYSSEYQRAALRVGLLTDNHGAASGFRCVH